MVAPCLLLLETVLVRLKRERHRSEFGFKALAQAFDGLASGDPALECTGGTHKVFVQAFVQRIDLERDSVANDSGQANAPT